MESKKKSSGCSWLFVLIIGVLIGFLLGASFGKDLGIDGKNFVNTILGKADDSEITSSEATATDGE